MLNDCVEEPSRRERLAEWACNYLPIVGSPVYGWFLNRRCRHCGEQRLNHPFGHFCRDEGQQGQEAVSDD